MWKVLLPIAILAIGVSCFKLTTEENNALQGYCGTHMKIPSKYARKITHGTSAVFNDAPWTARMLVKRFKHQKGKMYTTGTLISPSHLLTFWHAFRRYGLDGDNKMYYSNATDLWKYCEGTDFVMDSEFTSHASVDFEIAGVTYKHRVKKITILEKCKTDSNGQKMLNANRPILFELAEPLKNDNIKPICLNYDQRVWYDSMSTFKFFGYGDSRSVTQGSKFMSAKIQATQCQSPENEVVCGKTDGKQLLNRGDHGGSVISQFGAQLTLVGLYIDKRFERVSAQNGTIYKFAHIAKYYSKICKLTGVCRKRYVPSTDDDLENLEDVFKLE